MYTFMIMSRSFLLRMRYDSDKSCRENKKTFYIQKRFFFFENRAVYEIMLKNINRAGQATDDNMAPEHFMLDTKTTAAGIA